MQVTSMVSLLDARLARTKAMAIGYKKLKEQKQKSKKDSEFGSSLTSNDYKNGNKMEFSIMNATTTMATCSVH